MCTLVMLLLTFTVAPAGAENPAEPEESPSAEEPAEPEETPEPEEPSAVPGSNPAPEAPGLRDAATTDDVPEEEEGEVERAAEDVPGGPAIAEGDTLVANHSFEDGLTGWRATDGDGGPAADDCTDVLSTGEEFSSAGSASLSIDTDENCPRAGAIGDPVPVDPEQSYTVWADVDDGTTAWIALHWIDADGEVIDTELSPEEAPGERLRVDGEPPAGTAEVQVEIGTEGDPLRADNVVISAPYTALDAQVRVQPQFLSSEAGTDENGRQVVWGMATGSEDDPGILMATDILTGEITRTVRLPGATGGWAVNQNPVTGTVYVGTYGAGALWLYTPGDEEAVSAGTPDIPAWDFGYDVAFDEEGNAYGGGWGEPTDGYPGASVYTYTEGEGFTGILGDLPLTDEAFYSRAVAYDEGTRTVLVGTGTQVNLFGCSIDEDECEDLTSLFDEEIQESVEVRDIVVSDGYALAWVGDGGSTGNDWLVVLDLERSEDGELEVEVVDEIPGVAYPGSSPIVDGQIYYTKAGSEDWPLFRYDIESGEETQLPQDVVILARQWDIVELDDPDWPGATLVGINSYGFLTRYNIETETIDVSQVDDIPDVSVRINSLATDPDGSIWSSGFLQGGIGRVTPMRDDEHETFELGSQAEQMQAHDGRIYQGNYPDGTITSFTAEQLRQEEPPTLECEIGAGQNRPYGLYSAEDRLYFGSQADTGQDTGAFGWLDPASDECTTIEGPIGQQSIDSITGSEGKIFGGGNIFYAYTSPPALDEASVLVFDEDTEDTQELALPEPGLRAVSAATTDDQGTVWFYAEGWLLALDPDTLEWIHAEEVFPDHEPGERIGGNYAQMLTGEDGKVYGNADGLAFAFDPAQALDSGSAQPKVLLSEGGPLLTVDDHGNMYLRNGAVGLLRIVPEDTPDEMPAVTATKESDPDSGETVAAGEQITYTLRFGNDGTATGDVDHTDDLSDVLDDADLTSEPSVSDGALSAETDGDTVHVTGSLEPGTSTTVTYTVQLREDADQGNSQVRNTLVATGEDPPLQCDPASGDCTQHPVGDSEDDPGEDPTDDPSEDPSDGPDDPPSEDASDAPGTDAPDRSTDSTSATATDAARAEHPRTGTSVMVAAVVAALLLGSGVLVLGLVRRRD